MMPAQYPHQWNLPFFWFKKVNCCQTIAYIGQSIGKLLDLDTTIRPDTANAVGILSRCTSASTETELQLRVGRYLKGTPGTRKVTAN